MIQVRFGVVGADNDHFSPLLSLHWQRHLWLADPLVRKEDVNIPLAKALLVFVKRLADLLGCFVNGAPVEEQDQDVAVWLVSRRDLIQRVHHLASNGLGLLAQGVVLLFLRQPSIEREDFYTPAAQQVVGLDRQADFGHCLVDGLLTMQESEDVTLWHGFRLAGSCSSFPMGDVAQEGHDLLGHSIWHLAGVQ